MAYNSSTSSLSFSSSISESSAYSSPCSSPTSLPLPLPLPPSPYVNKLSVPFLWEEKPGITKPYNTPSSSSLKPSTFPKSLFYGHSLELPPLPPPPCLSHPRSKEIKLPSFHSLISRRSNEAKPLKVEQHQDPFFLALKACTMVDNREEKSSFDGLPAALSIFKPTKKSGYSSEDCNHHHQTRRDVSFNHHHHHHHQTRRELSFNGEGNGRCTSIATSTHGALHDLFSIEERASRVAERRGSNLYTLMLEKDEESTNSIAKRAHHHMNATGKASSISGCFMNVGIANRDKEDDPIQALHAKASRREHLMVGGQSKPKVIDADGHRKPKHKAYNGRQSNDALDRIKQGHSRAKHNAHVVEFNYCGGYIKNHDIDVYKHHSNQLNMSMSDMLGCKPLPPLHGAAIHPSLYFQDKLFSRPR